MPQYNIIIIDIMSVFTLPKPQRDETYPFDFKMNLNKKPNFIISKKQKCNYQRICLFIISIEFQNCLYLL